MRNLHKLYYRDYFSGLSCEIKQNASGKTTVFKSLCPIKEKNKLFTDHREIPPVFPLHSHAFGKDIMEFELQTLYPGLITGIGIEHGARIEGELKLGIHLDYTTGMPVIYGSSVKGVLSSYFKEFLIKENNLPENEALHFVKDIFEGKTYNPTTKKDESKSVYDRDIFFDAIIVRQNQKNEILAIDTLAPHGNNPLKNPDPISFLKIAAGVTLKFRFKLVDSVIYGQKLKAKDKREIFEKILTTVGIGAKTNVGYGQLKATASSKLQ